MDLRERIASLMGQVRSELAELVAIRSVADPRQFPPEECARAARWVRDAFAGVGFSDARLAEMADGSQAVLGARPGPDPDAPTVLLYAHYDVQPPLKEADWRTPPFELTEAGGRWYGRGAADCKGNIVMHLTALRALGDEVPVNLKLVVEGSEETTGALEDFVPGHADLLRADAVLVCDAGNAAVGHPAVTVSLRGVADVVVHVEALASELHSGTFGGAAPDARAGQQSGMAGRALPGRNVQGGRRRARRGVPARRRHGIGHGLVAPGGHDPRHRLPAGARVDGRDNAARERPPEPARPARDAGRRGSPVARQPPARCRPLGGSRDGRNRSARIGLPGQHRRPGVPGHRRGHARGLRPADGDAGGRRLHPAVQRTRRHLPGR